MNPVEDLVNKAREWWNNVELLNHTRVGPALLGKKAELLTRAKNIRNKLEAIPGLKPLLDFPPTDIAGLGLPLLLPVIGAATIASSILLIKNWNIENGKIVLAMDMASKGVAPEEIKKVVDAIGETGVSASVGKLLDKTGDLLKWALGGLLLLKFIGK